MLVLFIQYNIAVKDKTMASHSFHYLTVLLYGTYCIVHCTDNTTTNYVIEHTTVRLANSEDVFASYGAFSLPLEFSINNHDPTH